MFLKSAEKLKVKKGKKDFVYPLYNGYSLVNVPNTALAILGAKPLSQILDKSILNKIDTKGIKKVVVILIDGLGYEMFLRSYKKDYEAIPYKQIASVRLEHGIISS